MLHAFFLSFFLSFFLGGEFVGQEGRIEDIPGKGQDLFGELLHAVAVDDCESQKAFLLDDSLMIHDETIP